MPSFLSDKNDDGKDSESGEGYDDDGIIAKTKGNPLHGTNRTSGKHEIVKRNWRV